MVAEVREDRALQAREDREADLGAHQVEEVGALKHRPGARRGVLELVVGDVLRLELVLVEAAERVDAAEEVLAVRVGAGARLEVDDAPGADLTGDHDLADRHVAVGGHADLQEVAEEGILDAGLDDLEGADPLERARRVPAVGRHEGVVALIDRAREAARDHDRVAERHAQEAHDARIGGRLALAGIEDLIDARPIAEELHAVVLELARQGEREAAHRAPVDRQDQVEDLVEPKHAQVVAQVDEIERGADVVEPGEVREREGEVDVPLEAIVGAERRDVAAQLLVLEEELEARLRAEGEADRVAADVPVAVLAGRAHALAGRDAGGQIEVLRHPLAHRDGDRLDPLGEVRVARRDGHAAEDAERHQGVLARRDDRGAIDVSRREVEDLADQSLGGAARALHLDLPEAHLEALDDPHRDLGALPILAEAHVGLDARVEIAALLVELGHARHRLLEAEIAEGLTAREPRDAQQLALADQLVAAQRDAVEEGARSLDDRDRDDRAPSPDRIEPDRPDARAEVALRLVDLLEVLDGSRVERLVEDAGRIHLEGRRDPPLAAAHLPATDADPIEGVGVDRREEAGVRQLLLEHAHDLAAQIVAREVRGARERHADDVELAAGAHPHLEHRAPLLLAGVALELDLGVVEAVAP